MAFNRNQDHQPFFHTAAGGESLEAQMPPPSPMDTDFSIPSTPRIDSVLSQSPVTSSPIDSLFSRSSSVSSSPMDTSFPQGFPTESPTRKSRTRSIDALSPKNTFFNIPCGSTTQPPLLVRTTPVLSQPSSSFAEPRLGSLPSHQSGFSAHRSSILTSRNSRQSSSSSSSNISHNQQLSSPSPFSNNNKNPAFTKKLQEMALPLAPLVQLTTGQVHPSFPPTLLNFWLLTDAELESLAHFYHQRTPCRWTACYPCPVTWDTSLGLEEKRRRIGKFIGLRGCETPVRVRSEEEIAGEARRAREVREEDEEVWRRKLHWY